jgi:hypothetical protein
MIDKYNVTRRLQSRPNSGHVNAVVQNISRSLLATTREALESQSRDLINVTDRICEIRDGSGIGVGAPQFGTQRGAYLAFTKKFLAPAM